MKARALIRRRLGADAPAVPMHGALSSCIALIGIYPRFADANFVSALIEQTPPF